MHLYWLKKDNEKVNLKINNNGIGCQKITIKEKNVNEIEPMSLKTCLCVAQTSNVDWLHH